MNDLRQGTRRRAFCRGLVGCIAGAATTPLRAHRLQLSTTEIEFRINRRALEVVHTIHLDDGVFLLRALNAGTGAQALEARERAALLYYVEQRFELISQGQKLPLEPVGAHFDGDALWMYQELNMSAMPLRQGIERQGMDRQGVEGLEVQQLDVRCALLHDLFPAARNQINYRIGSEVSSLYLDASSPHGRLSL